jgi:ribosome-binding factor A
MDHHRSERVSESVREELVELISFELGDPRLETVEVLGVIVAPNGRDATVRVGIRGDETAQRRGLAALDHAIPYLRRQLALRLALRRVPELHFTLDPHPDAEDRVALLLKRAKKMRSRSENLS